MGEEEEGLGTGVWVRGGSGIQSRAETLPQRRDSWALRNCLVTVGTSEPLIPWNILVEQISIHLLIH